MRRVHIPRAWRDAAETILAEQPHVTLVLGGANVGKSTFCRYLIDELVKVGRRVAFVDAGVGQKDLGPPATVGGVRNGRLASSAERTSNAAASPAAERLT